jgi:hypothetical protein
VTDFSILVIPSIGIATIPHDAIQHRAHSSASQSFVWFTRL